MDKKQEIVRDQLQKFMEVWKNHDTKQLTGIIHPDIHAWLSTCKNTPDSSQHSLFGVCDFINSIPRTDKFEYDITNFICRFQGNIARQYAEVACKASNQDGSFFAFVAMFANKWEIQADGSCFIIEMRMDVNPCGGNLREVFEKVWLFEPELAILSGSVHLPCIFPELDSPYLHAEKPVVTDEEAIAACITSYFYGIDQLQFIHVKNALSDRYEGGKYEYTVTRKFLRQRYRYQSHPYQISRLEANEATAEVVLSSMLESFPDMLMELEKNTNGWQILSIKEVAYA